MNDQQIPLIKTSQMTKLETLSREELIERVQLWSDGYEQLEKIYTDAMKRNGLSDQEHFSIKEQLLIIRHKLYAPSSEKRPKPKDESVVEAQKKAKESGEKNTDPHVLLPSLKYPNVLLKESHVTFEEGKEPCCKLCSEKLTPMGDQTEDSEWVSVTQKVYFVQRQQKQKYRCGNCHADIQTTPGIPRIVPGGGFSDEIAIDVAVAKYCDHLPINRYVRQAERGGLKGVNPQSLIEQTHFLADFLTPVYDGLKKEVQSDEVLGADETHWKMLEGDDKTRWQLWGFFTGKAAYYEAHDTRAAHVAGDFLKECKAKYLVSDAYCGYSKCTQGTEVKNAFCHAHARRRWKDAEHQFPVEAEFMLKRYDQLYDLEREIKNQPPDVKRLEREKRARPILEEMKNYAINLWCLPKSSVGKAKNYFLDNFEELMRYLENGLVPIDNNRSERGLRGPVVGRKNFYGNHSKRGARTMQILYSIMESCKLCKVEPHGYIQSIVQDIHQGRDPVTPAEFIIRSHEKTNGQKT